MSRVKITFKLILNNNFPLLMKKIKFLLSNNYIIEEEKNLGVDRANV